MFIKRLILASAVSAALSGVINAEQTTTEEQSHGNQATGDSAAEIAVEAYDKADAAPTENWFGCPPAPKSEDTEQSVEDREHCDTEAAQNTPQVEEIDKTN